MDNHVTILRNGPSGVTSATSSAKANVDAADDDAGAGWRGGWLEQPSSRRPFAEANRLWMALGPTVEILPGLEMPTLNLGTCCGSSPA